MKAVVIGGGIAGLTSAWALTDLDADITVYDNQQVGRASVVAAGMLAPASELEYGESELFALARESVAAWPTFAATLREQSGIDVQLRLQGTLLLATHPDEQAELARRQRLIAAHGAAVEPLDAAAVRRLEPALTTRSLRALLVRDDLSVDPRPTLEALRIMLQRNGVRACKGGVQLVREGDRVIGVRRPGGDIEHADLVVLAAGVGSRELARQVGLELPVRPVKGELIRVRTAAPALTHTIRAHIDPTAVYLVPRRDQEIVIGATSVDAGTDVRRTTRAALDLLHAAAEVVPELLEAEILAHDVGLRPGTPDNGPYLGACPLAGLVVATGHYRHGFLLAPITAAVVRAAAAGERPPSCAEPFRPDRHHPTDRSVP